MTALRDYQDVFAVALAAGDADPALALFEGPMRRRQRGFRVYANNRMHALVSALGDTFPAVRRSLGENMFTAVAVGYVRAHPPPRDPLLLWYGQHLPDFLESFEDTFSPHLPDLARLDYAWLEAYHAAEAAPLTAAQVAALAPEQLVAARLRLHPSVRLLRSRWAIDRIWRGASGLAGGDRPEETAEETLAEKREGECCLVVARPLATVLVLPVSPPVLAALAAFCADAAFADATMDLGEARHLAELQALIAAGVFTAIESRSGTRRLPPP